MEKKTRNNIPNVSAKLFSIARSDTDSSGKRSSNSGGIVIQIRMKAPSGKPANKLVTRKNTEFWLSAGD